MCGVFKENKSGFWKSKKLLFGYDAAIKNGLVHQWSIAIKIYKIISRNTFLN